MVNKWSEKDKEGIGGELPVSLLSGKYREIAAETTCRHAAAEVAKSDASKVSKIELSPLCRQWTKRKKHL